MAPHYSPHQLRFYGMLHIDVGRLLQDRKARHLGELDDDCLLIPLHCQHSHVECLPVSTITTESKFAWHAC